MHPYLVFYSFSCDSIESHCRWLADIAKYGNENQRENGPKIDAPNFPFPIIGDVNRTLASKLGMLDPLNLDMAGIPLTVRAVFIIDSKKRLRLVLLSF
jgi:peroxiredoxin 6